MFSSHPQSTTFLFLSFFFLMPLPSAPRKSSSSTLLSTFAFPFVSDEIDEGLCALNSPQRITQKIVGKQLNRNLRRLDYYSKNGM